MPAEELREEGAAAVTGNMPGEVDYSATLLPWRRLPFPAPWDEIFGSSGPLNLEIGFGDGRYTIRSAQQRAGERFVGLEISTGSVVRAMRRAKREGTGNVRLLKAGAQFATRHLFSPHLLSSIVVNFPDPWPKERHARNRLLRRPFFELAASRLRAGGAILLATDHPDYLQGAQEEARKSGLFRVEEREPPPEVFETKYALKWREQGKPLHYRAFVYEGGSPPHFPVLERPAVMPHALMLGRLPNEDEAHMSKQVLAYGDGHVILHEAARSALVDGPERWLFRVTVDEPDLKQHLLVVAQRRGHDEDGDVIVRLESFGDPIITRTARGAVHAVTEWLLAKPGIRLLERNY